MNDSWMIGDPDFGYGNWGPISQETWEWWIRFENFRANLNESIGCVLKLGAHGLAVWAAEKVGEFFVVCGSPNAVEWSISTAMIHSYELWDTLVHECYPVFWHIVHGREPYTPRVDPLVLDLDGDGIKTASVNGPTLTFFDNNVDAFAEQTGWIAPGSGLLCMDRNGNGIIDDGKELFGNQTILANGQKAANGFHALAELDSNHDGKIDANDSGFWQLRVFKLNDADDTYQLYTLNELGIKSINLDSTVMNSVDAQGNTQNRVGTFEMADGTIRQIADYSFQIDTTYTVATAWLDVPDDIAALPDVPGYGNVYSLHQAMVRDASGRLEALVEEFAAEEDLTQRSSILEQIIFAWTGSNTPGEVGDPWGWAKFKALEKFYGASWPVFTWFGGGSGGSGDVIPIPPWTPGRLAPRMEIQSDGCQAYESVSF
ncbi:MAG TPA: hypothetical protein VK463_20210 [Desulfomonilaceae bacterium]|nr:hypothetical protein [Desulfomonilaceae bacterium]